MQFLARVFILSYRSLIRQDPTHPSGSKSGAPAAMEGLPPPPSPSCSASTAPSINTSPNTPPTSSIPPALNLASSTPTTSSCSNSNYVVPHRKFLSISPSNSCCRVIQVRNRTIKKRQMYGFWWVGWKAHRMVVPFLSHR